MRIACGKMMIMRMMMGTAQPINRGNASISSMVLFSFCFHFYCQSLHGRNLSLLVFFDRRIADRVPVFAFHENAAAARIDRGQCSHRFPNERFLPHFYRQQLRAQTLPDDKNKERPYAQSSRNDVIER